MRGFEVHNWREENINKWREENINKNMLTEIEIRGKVNDRKRARDGGG